jgi:2-polyprenyl-3-methyl-5-hydroxy-6-metoxy-1,4-benzoquinol methylase
MKETSSYDYTKYVEKDFAPAMSQSLDDFEAAYEDTLSRLSLSEGYKVLDVGGGAGQLDALLARRHCVATLLDVSESGIRFAEQVCRTKLPREDFARVRFVTGDLSQQDGLASLLSTLGGNYDVIIMRQVWEHLTPDQCRTTINNCRNLLSPKGYIYIETAPNAPLADFLRWTKRTFLRVHGGYKEDGLHINEQSFWTLRKALEDFTWADAVVRPYLVDHWLYINAKLFLVSRKQKILLPLVYVISAALNILSRIPFLTRLLCFGVEARLTLAKSPDLDRRDGHP